MSDTLVAPHPAAPPDAAARRSVPSRVRQFHALTKPRVVQLIVFCAVIGMLMAVPGLPDLRLALAATAGIWLVSAAAAALNCLVEQRIDAKMARTAWRPTARGELGRGQALVFSAALCAAGSAILWFAVNPLTLLLTLATFVGYAVVYTVLLKPMTPQNIVIGGASGAMPPVLGWVAIRGEVGPEALMMCLIIFLWTPPHFWSLALYRADDYRRAGLPMLPVTHGSEFTRLHVFLYTLVLFAGTMLPFVQGMSGWPYLVAALVLNAGFVGHAWQLRRRYSDALAKKTFRFSIVYLALLFAALLVDHYLRPLPVKRVLQVLPRRRLAGAAGLGLLLAGCDKLGLSPKPAASFRGADISGAEFGRSLSLPDVNGQARSLSDFKGKVTLVFFGYTQCPDVCPTTMSELAQIKKTLGPDGDRLQGVFITVDPERDTPAILKTYVASFDPSFVALRGTLAQTEAAAKEFKVYFAKVPGKVEGSYTMDHSAGAYLLDAQARPRVFARYGAGTDGLEADIRTLIAQS